MKVVYTQRVHTTLDNLPNFLRDAFFKQIRFLGHDLWHPSLRAKKYNANTNLWQARVNKKWRFYFIIRDNDYYVVDVIPHPK